MTLLDRLSELFPEASGRSVKQWLEHGRVEVDGHVVRDGRATVGAAARITLGRHGAVPFPPALRLVHEDDDLLVDRQAVPACSTIATDRERERTAYRLLWDYRPGPAAAASTLHRPPTGPRDVGPPRLREVRARQAPPAGAVRGPRRRARSTVAVVEGRVSEEQGTLESRLTAGPRAPRPLGDAGKLAITRYRVRERRRDRTVLELSLGTGRRQQIRVQLAELGHPIVGDPAAWKPLRAPPPSLPAREPPRLRPSEERRARALRERAPSRLGIIASVFRQPSPRPSPRRGEGPQEASWPLRHSRSRTRSPS